MTEEKTITNAGLRTPRSAAVSGILFALLAIVFYWLFRISIPADPSDPGVWLRADSRAVGLGLNLVPVAGVAFLWFIGVVRDRLAAQEDRLFSTVFFGSGLLFLGMFFAGSSVIGAIILAFSGAPPEDLAGSDAFHIARAVAYNIAHVYMIKMAAVFVVSLSTVILATGIAARWLAYLGYVLAALLLFIVGYLDWIFLTFPLWILLISVHILMDSLRRSPKS